MDRPGTVAGVVSLADTGQAASSGYLGISAWNFGAGPAYYASIGTDGRYTLTGLGPYDWPLHAVVDGAAPQWSGGVGNRFKAARIPVRAGETTTYSPAADGAYQMRVLGPQPVKIQYEWSTPESGFQDGWYDGASGYADATKVNTPTSGKKTLNITLR